MKMIQDILYRGGINHDHEWKKQFQKFIFISLSFHLLAAYFSVGFYKPDEHFQILEFLNYKISGIDSEGLPHEFAKEMRAWIQPGFYYVIAKCLTFLGIKNPFTWAFVFRLVSSIIGWISLALFGLCFFIWFPNSRVRNWALFLLTYLWWIPYLHARTSSENLTTSFFFFALAIITLYTHAPANGNNAERETEIPTGILAFTGFCCGLAFEFRYSTGLMVLGLMMWLLLIKKISLQSICFIGFSLCCAVLLGIFVDRWGYGHWSFPPMNYFAYNIIESPFTDSDKSPWWYYLYSIGKNGLPPLSIIIVFTTLIAWIRHPKHILTWSTILFFVIHSIIGHKEDRFLYPMTYAAVAFVFLSIPNSWFKKGTVDKYLKKKWVCWFIKITVSLNICLLIIASLVPSRTEVNLHKRLYRISQDRLEIYSIKQDPYIFHNNKFRFYAPREVIFHKVSDSKSLEQELNIQSEPIVFLHYSNWLKGEMKFLENRCQVLYRSFPEWVNKLNVTNWLSRTTTFLLLECQ